MTDRKVSSLIRSILARKFETGDDYYLFNLREVPHERCDGFWPSTNGGWTVNREVFLSTFESSGRRFGVKAVDDHINECIDEALSDAKKAFAKEHEEFAYTDFDYNSLREESRPELAEELSEMEHNELDQYTVNMVLTVRIFMPNSQYDKYELRNTLHITIMGWIEVGGKTFDIVDKTITKRDMFRRKISQYATQMSKLFEAGEE